jgi:hypothetical protein
MAAHDDNSIELTVLSYPTPASGLVNGGLRRRRRRVFTPSAVDTIRGLAAQGKISLGDSRSNRLDRCQRPGEMLPAKHTVAEASPAN